MDSCLQANSLNLHNMLQFGERKDAMFKFLLMVAVIVAGLWVLQQNLPDIERYMKLRQM